MSSKSEMAAIRIARPDRVPEGVQWRVRVRQFPRFADVPAGPQPGKVRRTAPSRRGFGALPSTMCCGNGFWINSLHFRYHAQTDDPAYPSRCVTPSGTAVIPFQDG
jgi:hypothetical protein